MWWSRFIQFVRSSAAHTNDAREISHKTVSLIHSMHLSCCWWVEAGICHTIITDLHADVTEICLLLIARVSTRRNIILHEFTLFRFLTETSNTRGLCVCELLCHPDRSDWNGDNCISWESTTDKYFWDWGVASLTPKNTHTPHCYFTKFCRSSNRLGVSRVIKLGQEHAEPLETCLSRLSYHSIFGHSTSNHMTVFMEIRQKIWPIPSQFSRPSLKVIVWCCSRWVFVICIF